MRVPTDREILEVIYDRYYDTFAFEGRGERAAKNYVPVDLASVAKTLGVDGDIVFGRLYYHLDQKYGYKRDDGTHVPFFYLKLRDDRHCVNFPLLASVLASLQTEHRKFVLSTSISIISLVIAITALVVSIASRMLT
jgi:hypothetical protein